MTEFYLKVFCDPVLSPRHGRFLWEVDVLTGAVRPQPPKRAATERDYYSFIDPSGALNHDVETMLSAVESRAAPVVTKLRYTRRDLTSEERSAVALFVAFLMVRVPAIRTYLEVALGRMGESKLRLAARHPEHFKRTMKARLAAAGKERVSDAEIEETWRLSVDPAKHFEIRGTPEVSLGLGLRTVIRLAELLFEMRWELLAVSGRGRPSPGTCP